MHICRETQRSQGHNTSYGECIKCIPRPLCYLSVHNAGMQVVYRV